MKKTIMVSNSWRPEEDSVCAECGGSVKYAWGDYSFRYYEQKDKSDLRVICKSCAAEMTRTDKQIKVIRRSPLMDMINLKNSGWKSQPKRQGSGFSIGNSTGSGLGAEINRPDEEDT